MLRTMKVIHLDGAETYEPEPDWKRASLCAEPKVSIEYFVKPPHHASPMHEHPQEQVTIVIKGKMKVVSSDGAEVVLGECDAAHFEGGELHQVVNVLDEPSIGLDVFTPSRSFDFWLKRLGK